MVEFTVILIVSGNSRISLALCFEYCFRRNKPFPPILKKSFVSSITSGEAYIYAGIFGFAKGSNFLKFVIETIGASYQNMKDYNKLWIPIKSGPIFFTAMFVSLDIFCTIS